MKTLIGLMIGGTLLWVSGCGISPDVNTLDGKWQGAITEKGKSIKVELSLLEREDTIEGTLTILGQTGQDVGEGAVFPIVEAERSGNNFKFVVPVTGKVDDDALAFDLKIGAISLTGHGRELRKGSENLPITFAKQE